MKRSAKRRHKAAMRSQPNAQPIGPGDAQLQQAMAHHRAGRLSEAETIYRQLLARGKNDPNLLHLLGLILVQSGRAEEGVGLMRQAVQLLPKSVDFRANLAAVAGSLGRHEEAAEQLREALALRPGDPHALNNLGAALEHLERHEESVAVLRQAVDSRPDFAEAWANLSNALRKGGDAEEGVQAAREAVRLKPELPEAWHALGAGLQESGTGRGDAETRGHGDGGIAGPTQHSAPSTQHSLDEAIFCLRRAVALRPQLVEAHVGLGAALLLRGDCEEGWRECEWRRSEARFHRPHGIPWDLSTTCGRPEADLAGKRLLLFAEGGLGNAIHFVRYVALLAKWAAEVIVECHPPLVPLMRQVKGIGRVIGFGEPSGPYDLYCPLPSLPALLGRQGLPPAVEVPYLTVDGERVEQWRSELDAISRVSVSPCPPVPASPRPRVPASLLVGVMWLAEQGTPWGRRRSIPLEHFAALAALPGVQLISLQKGWAPQPSPCPLPEGEGGDAGKVRVIALPDLDQEGGAFLDTAAVIANLDLVITCDTSIAHLAGALGAPTWVALGAAPDWRWMLDRQDTPWYPTLRLFRQQTEGDWAGVLERMADCLSTWGQADHREGDKRNVPIPSGGTWGPGDKEIQRQPIQLSTQHPALSTAHREPFQRIYDQHLWGGGSGHGSRKTSTAPYRQLLQRLVASGHVKRIVDLGCGDWQFSRLIDWDGIEYLGVDVVPALIEANRREHGRENVRFECADVRTGQPPEADLYILKDVLQHWPDQDIKAFLSRMAGRQMLITNSAPTAEHVDLDMPGEFRPLDLRRPPFNLTANELLRYEAIPGDEKLVLLT